MHAPPTAMLNAPHSPGRRARPNISRRARVGGPRANPRRRMISRGRAFRTERSAEKSALALPAGLVAAAGAALASPLAAEAAVTPSLRWTSAPINTHPHPLFLAGLLCRATAAASHRRGGGQAGGCAPRAGLERPRSLAAGVRVRALYVCPHAWWRRLPPTNSHDDAPPATRPRPPTQELPVLPDRGRNRAGPDRGRHHRRLRLRPRQARLERREGLLCVRVRREETTAAAAAAAAAAMVCA